MCVSATRSNLQFHFHWESDWSRFFYTFMNPTSGQNFIISRDTNSAVPNLHDSEENPRLCYKKNLHLSRKYLFPVAFTKKWSQVLSCSTNDYAIIRFTLVAKGNICILCLNHYYCKQQRNNRTIYERRNVSVNVKVFYQPVSRKFFSQKLSSYNQLLLILAE